MDKNKIIQTATKYLQRGQFDKAIAEYERILRKDPKDVRILLKLGEVQQKKGDDQQAASTLFEVAQSYAADGFYLKAVAVYKQVLKLDPKRYEVNQRLAEQYQQLGLLSDAMGQLQIVANWQKQSDDLEGALETLRRMTELEPESVPPRLELAEILEKQGRKKEALEELERAAQALEEARRTDDYLRVAERILKVKGGDPALSRKLAERYLAKGDSKRALARLQACYEANPKDAEVLELLAKIFQDLGKQAKAVAALKELARSLREQGRSEEESRIWSRVRLLAPDDEEAGLAVGARSQASPAPRQRGLDSTDSRMILSTNTGTATGRPISLKPGAVDADTPVGKMLTEVDVYLKYRLYDKAKDHLQKVRSMEPDSVEAAERACLVHAALNDQASLREELMRLVRLHRAAGDPVRAAQCLNQLREVAPGDPEVEALAAEPSATPAAGGRRSATPFNPFDDTSEAALFAATLAGDPDDEEIVDEPLLNEIGELAVEVEEPGEEILLEEDEEVLLAVGADGLLGSPVEVEAPPAPAAAAPPPAPEPLPPPAVAEAAPAAVEEIDELEEVDFYLDQQMLEEAAEVLESLRSRYPGHPEVEKRLARLERETAAGQQAAPPPAAEVPAPAPTPAPTPTPTPSTPRQVIVPPPPPMPDAAPAAPPPAAPAAPREAASSPGGRVPVPAFARAVVPPQADDATFNLGAELQGMLRELSQVGSSVESGPEVQFSAEDVLAEFKKGISKTVRPEDWETHYNLGVAYREMGLLQEALESFRMVAEGAVGQEWEVGGWTMVGICHAELNAHEEAIAAFRKGLESPALSEEAGKALNFEIARSLEALGRPEEALAYYGKVARVDSGYRDVARAIMRLAGLDG